MYGVAYAFNLPYTADQIKNSNIPMSPIVQLPTLLQPTSADEKNPTIVFMPDSQKIFCTLIFKSTTQRSLLKSDYIATVEPGVGFYKDAKS